MEHLDRRHLSAFSTSSSINIDKRFCVSNSNNSNHNQPDKQKPSTTIPDPKKSPNQPTSPTTRNNNANPTHRPLRIQTHHNPRPSRRCTYEQLNEQQQQTLTSTLPKHIHRQIRPQTPKFKLTPSRLPSQVCKRMIGLAEKCTHPTRNEPYMKSHGGGRDNSPEGQQVARSLPFSPFKLSDVRRKEKRGKHANQPFFSLVRELSVTGSSASLRMPKTGSISEFHFFSFSWSQSLFNFEGRIPS